MDRGNSHKVSLLVIAGLTGGQRQGSVCDAIRGGVDKGPAWVVAGERDGLIQRGLRGYVNMTSV